VTLTNNRKKKKESFDEAKLQKKSRHGASNSLLALKASTKKLKGPDHNRTLT